MWLKSDSKWKAHFHREFTKGAHGLRPHMWPVRTCVRTYARNSKPIWKALYVEWSLEKDPSRNVNFKLWNYPLLNVLFISNQTLNTEKSKGGTLLSQKKICLRFWWHSKYEILMAKRFTHQIRMEAETTLMIFWKSKKYQREKIVSNRWDHDTESHQKFYKFWVSVPFCTELYVTSWDHRNFKFWVYSRK